MNNNKNKETFVNKYQNYINKESKQEKNTIIESIKLYLIIVIIIFTPVFLFENLSFLSVLLLFVILYYFFRKKNTNLLKNRKKKYINKSEIEKNYLTYKNIEFLKLLDELNKINNENLKIKEQFLKLKLSKDKELKKQAEILKKTIKDYEELEQNLIIQLKELSENKIFVLDFPNLKNFNELNEYEKELISFQVYFPFLFFTQYIKLSINKFFTIKTEKITGNIKVYILE